VHVLKPRRPNRMHRLFLSIMNIIGFLITRFRRK
jgi:hypothetical protein